MKGTELFVLLVCVLLVVGVNGDKPRKLKKATEQKKLYIQKNIERLMQKEAELENEIEKEMKELEDEEEEFPEYIPSEEEEEEDDPCEGKHCGAGQECIIDENGEAACQCITKCHQTGDNRRVVCSNHNDTWQSDCDLHRMRCLCKHGNELCTNQKHKHMHIDYYGSCQEVPACEEEEMEDFPRRMREWLFNIMRDMADREELSPHYLKLEQMAEEDEQKKWSFAAVWKWCTLDERPKDSAVSRHELFPIRAPLHTLEYCMSPFLNSCDADNDHEITLQEWITCLKLTDDHVEDLEDMCENIRNE